MIPTSITQMSFIYKNILGEFKVIGMVKNCDEDIIDALDRWILFPIMIRTYDYIRKRMSYNHWEKVVNYYENLKAERNT